MASEVTPYRETLITFDGVETVAAEPPFAEFRAGSDIARDPSGCSNVEQIGSGDWRIASFNTVQHYVKQRTDNHGARMQLTDFEAADGMASRARYRKPSDLTGVSIDPNVATSGDNWIQPTVAAGGSWHHDTLAPDLAAAPDPPRPTSNISMSRVLISVNHIPADHGFQIEWDIHANRIYGTDDITTYQFGGPAAVNNNGWFGLAVRGDGTIKLFEREDDTGTRWVLRDWWQYAPANALMDSHHRLRVIPANLGNGRGALFFTHGMTSVAPVSGGNVITAFHAPQYSPDQHVVYLQLTADRPTVTGPGPIRASMPDDLRIPVAITLERYFASGIVQDNPFVLPFNVTKRAPIQLQWSGAVPSGTLLEGRLYDADTDTELTSTDSGDNFKTYTPNYGQSRYYAKFTLTADGGGTLSPTLHAYSVLRDGYYIQPSETTPFFGGVVRSVSISGGESDPSHETASVLIDDAQNVLPELRTRASLPVRIETRYDPLNPALTSVLFDGYAERNEAERMGYKGGQLYPSPYWSRITGQWVGMWTRLHEQVLFARIKLGVDKDAPPDANGSRPPLKITDVVRSMIGYAGYGPTQIDVPDNPTRFFPIPGVVDADSVQPGTNIGEWVTRTLRDWLGWFLTWDGNAGTDGMWRAIPPPTSPYRNLADFTLDAPAGCLPHRPESYGSTNWVGTDTSPVLAPVLKYRSRRLRTWVKRPEANWIVVTGTGQLLPNKNGQNKLTTWAVNFASVNAMATTGNATVSSADPTNPDYLGRLVPLAIVDPTLQTEEAVNWFARRYYDVTAHAIKMASFMAPLVLVYDTADPHATRPRPLRYYDPVLIYEDGIPSQWLVRNVNPQYEKDGIQMAYYELEAPRF